MSGAVAALVAAFEAFVAELEAVAAGTPAAPDDDLVDRHHHHEHFHQGVGSNHRHAEDGRAIDETSPEF